MYKAIFTENLNEIIKLFDENKIEGENEAIDKFKKYLVEIQKIGSFGLTNWKQSWRKRVWKFGELFKSYNPSKFLYQIDRIINSSLTENVEVIEFIRSEIIVNYLPDNECKKQLEKLIETYPLNPEFRNTLGHYFSREGQEFKAIEQYKLAHKIDPTNNDFFNSRFKAEQKYLDELIKNGDYQKGKDYINSIFKEKEYIDAGNTIRNTFVDFSRRFNDHLHFQDKLRLIEDEFKKKMRTELDTERKRIIEILGFFSAIVAFILSTVSIGNNFKFLEAIYFIIALGIVLIIFSISLSVSFSTKETKLVNDKNFWILVLSLIIIFVFILVSASISNVLDIFI